MTRTLTLALLAECSGPPRFPACQQALAQIAAIDHDSETNPTLLYGWACAYAVAHRVGIGVPHPGTTARRLLVLCWLRDTSRGWWDEADLDIDLSSVIADARNVRIALDELLAQAAQQARPPLPDEVDDLLVKTGWATEPATRRRLTDPRLKTTEHCASVATASGYAPRELRVRVSTRSPALPTTGCRRAGTRPPSARSGHTGTGRLLEHGEDHQLNPDRSSPAPTPRRGGRRSPRPACGRAALATQGRRVFADRTCIARALVDLALKAVGPGIPGPTNGGRDGIEPVTPTVSMLSPHRPATHESQALASAMRSRRPSTVLEMF